MKQTSLAPGGFDQYGKTTKRATLLAEVDRVVPWAQLCSLIEPHPKAGRGRYLVCLERMLRIHFLQHWFNVSDLAVTTCAIKRSAPARIFKGLGAKPQGVDANHRSSPRSHAAQSTAVDTGHATLTPRAPRLNSSRIVSVLAAGAVDGAGNENSTNSRTRATLQALLLAARHPPHVRDAIDA